MTMDQGMDACSPSWQEMQRYVAEAESDIGRLKAERDQLREALEEVLHDTRSYDAKQIARAALKATEVKS